ncbi:redoxin domain-containing protein [Flavobacteriaceae bacterium Ap0902]|nr:redoxin domain-containing protein [Flavobacteriaceae bacterium Ap0902]
MKKILWIAFSLLTFFACQDEPKDYVTLEGEVENLIPEADSITVFIPDGYKKQIAIQEDGTFKDTLKVEEGKYQFKIGDEYGTIYLRNNDEVKIITDYSDFDQKLNFEGKNTSANISNAFINRYKLSSEYLNKQTLDLPKNQFDSVLVAYENEYAAFKTKNSNIPPSIWKDMDAEMKNSVDGFKKYYQKSQEIKEKFTGKPSPEFAMESIDGDIVRLSDFKGKYVYIDVWATWCGPCKREIPHLKELEQEYHDREIVFVSMSIDPAKDKQKWANFVKDEDLKGVQIFAENDWKSDFVKAYEIQGIPRFILVGKEGEIVSPDAPRPSDDNLVELFNELNI